MNNKDNILSKKSEYRFSDVKKSFLSERVARLIRICSNMDVPVLIIVDGFENSGRGAVINDLVKDLDAKRYDVEVFEKNDYEDSKYPFIKRFWQNIPSKGRVKIFDRSFYFKLFNNLEYDKEELDRHIDNIKSIEHMLYDDQTIIIKFFLNISKETQKERMEKIENTNRKSFYMQEIDEIQNEKFDKYKDHIGYILEETDFPLIPWNIIDANDISKASREVMGITLDELTKGIERVGNQRADEKNITREYEGAPQILENLDLDKDISDEEYKELKDELQKRAADLMFEFYDRGISQVLVFEGVDAAGKDGSINRLVGEVDPRLYTVHAISAPTEEELNHHYLWRFYKKLPDNGYAGIFSRSWYGRVMVERVEGFATTREWDRAYDEILDMERQIYEHGSLVIKFFVVIDKETQLERFKSREDTPDKNYKITDEDWRNRDKWDIYIEAMNEMLDRTNVDYAPWIIVEGNNKKYARIKVLKEYIKLCEEHLKKIDK